MATIKYIEFGFENCETIFIHTKHIEYLSIQDIKQNISIVRKQQQSNHTTCKRFAVKLESDGNTYAYNEKKNRMIFDENQSPFERMDRHRDIVDITLHYDNKTSRTIHMPWKGDDHNDENHHWQSSTLRDDGSICILVSKKGNIETYFRNI